MNVSIIHLRQYSVNECFGHFLDLIRVTLEGLGELYSVLYQHEVRIAKIRRNRNKQIVNRARDGYYGRHINELMLWN